MRNASVDQNKSSQPNHLDYQQPPVLPGGQNSGGGINLTSAAAVSAPTANGAAAAPVRTIGSMAAPAGPPPGPRQQAGQGQLMRPPGIVSTEPGPRPMTGPRHSGPMAHSHLAQQRQSQRPAGPQQRQQQLVGGGGARSGDGGRQQQGQMAPGVNPQQQQQVQGGMGAGRAQQPSQQQRSPLHSINKQAVNQQGPSGAHPAGSRPPYYPYGAEGPSVTQHNSSNQQQPDGVSYQRPYPPPAQQTLRVPQGNQFRGRAPVPAARRGTNVAASKRTRFALQVQRPTGEDSLDVLQGGRGGGSPRRSRSPDGKSGSDISSQMLQPSHDHPDKNSPSFRPDERQSYNNSRMNGHADDIPSANSSQLAHHQNGQPRNVSDHRPVSMGPEGGNYSSFQPVMCSAASSSSQAQHANSNLSGTSSSVDPAATAGCSPITLEYAEELLIMAKQGRCSVLDISDAVKERPPGGYVYIYKNKERPYAWKDEDGYAWVQILHQMALATGKGNKIDYFHFYLELPGASHQNQKKKSSPHFRKEAYKLDDFTLVAYIGKSETADSGMLRDGSNSGLITDRLNQVKDRLNLGLDLSKDQHMAKLLEDKNRITEDIKRLTGDRIRREDMRAATLRSSAIDEKTKYSSAKEANQAQLAGLGRGYNTISGTSVRRAQTLRPRKQRSHSLERIGTALGAEDGRLAVGLQDTSHFLSDPDMLTARLVEQQYLQALVEAKRCGQQDRFMSLMDLSAGLSNGKFVKNISIYPSLQVTLVHPDMTREFENICKILYSERCPGDLAEETMKLFYDHTFEIGNLYLTVLTFTNYFYIGAPVMPLAVNLHERKFKSSHSMFWARVLCDIPALAKYRFPIVINEAEPAVHLAVKAHAPNLVQFEGWIHRFKDMDRYMRQKGYGAHAVAYFKACVKYLLMSDSKNEMQDKFRKEFESIWPRDFVNYFRERILPKANRLGKWALGELNIYDDSFFNHAGSPQERFHIRCNQFLHWDTLSLPQLLQGLYLVFTFYVNECSNGKSGQGVFAIHPDLKPLFCEMLPENLPYNSCPNPSQIVDYLKSREKRTRDERLTDPERSRRRLESIGLVSPRSGYYPGVPNEDVYGQTTAAGLKAWNSPYQTLSWSPTAEMRQMVAPYLVATGMAQTGPSGAQLRPSHHHHLPPPHGGGGAKGVPPVPQQPGKGGHGKSAVAANSVVSSSAAVGGDMFPFGPFPPSSAHPSAVVAASSAFDPVVGRAAGNQFLFGMEDDLCEDEDEDECYLRGAGTSTAFLADRHTATFTMDHIAFTSGKIPTGFLTNGEHHSDDVPSPAPGGSPILPSSPQRKLSVIPEIPGLSDSRYSSRPPSLAELAAAKQKSDRSSDCERTDHVLIDNKNEQYGVQFYDPEPMALNTSDRMHQLSIDSSIVTEGHYDASFETEDQPSDPFYPSGTNGGLSKAAMINQHQTSGASIIPATTAMPILAASATFGGPKSQTAVGTVSGTAGPAVIGKPYRTVPSSVVIATTINNSSISSSAPINTTTSTTAGGGKVLGANNISSSKAGGQAKTSSAGNSNNWSFPMSGNNSNNKNNSGAAGRNGGILNNGTVMPNSSGAGPPTEGGINPSGQLRLGPNAAQTVPTHISRIGRVSDIMGGAGLADPDLGLAHPNNGEPQHQRQGHIQHHQASHTQVKQMTEGEEGMMLWKRVRHCVVFGGTILKTKKDK